MRSAHADFSAASLLAENGHRLGDSRADFFINFADVNARSVYSWSRSLFTRVSRTFRRDRYNVRGASSLDSSRAGVRSFVMRDRSLLSLPCFYCNLQIARGGFVRASCYLLENDDTSRGEKP